MRCGLGELWLGLYEKENGEFIVKSIKALVVV